MSRFQNFTEILIVYGVMTGIFLPVRLAFVVYVSDNWFGSFGLISAISILILILALKNKLGIFGDIFKRQMNHLQKGKLGKIMYFQVVFLLVVFGVMVFSIEMGNSYYSKLKDDLLSENNSLSNYGLMMGQDQDYSKLKDDLLSENNSLSNYELIDEIYQTVTPERLLFGILLSVTVFFFEFPMFSAALAIINDIFDGWLLHFYTVGFVEYLEILMIMIFFRTYNKINNHLKKFTKFSN